MRTTNKIPPTIKKIQKQPNPFFKKEGTALLRSVHQPFFNKKPIQRKLSIGQPNDKYEKEADAMANKVVNTAQASIAGKAIQRKCEDCEKEEKIQKVSAEEEKELQMKAVSDKEEVQKKALEEDEAIQMKAEDVAKAESPTLASQLNSSKGNGNALPKDTRVMMEHSLDADFSSVKIHTDEKAVQMSQQLHAQAFTHGSDIYFNKGKYDPSSSGGKHLLAHELTHVVQQNTALREKRIQRDLVYGSGYAGYASTAAEVGKAKQSKWNPTTIDFSKNVGRSGGGEGAKDLPALIGLIEKKGKGSIKKLGIIGHSNSRALGLSGDVHTQGVPLTGLVTSSTLKANKAKIDSVKDRFATGAEITLYSCNSGGISDGLADAVSEAFGVCVNGFSNEVIWCITWNEKPLEITRRGNVFYENPDDPLAGIGAHPKCANFHTKVLDLSPDVTSCKGAKKKGNEKCVLPEEIFLPEARSFQLASFSESANQAPDHFFNQSISNILGLKLNDGINTPDPELRASVREMQQSLNRQGASLKEDGIFGQNTLSYLHQFQSRLGLPQTQIVDDNTAFGLMLPEKLFGDQPLLSKIEGLKVGDGLVWRTWHLRPQISQLQQLLGIHGHFTKVDGMFGPDTKRALNNFQILNGLPTTEIVDRLTADRLEGRNSNFCPFGELPATLV